jgi:hypothetical protein
MCDIFIYDSEEDFQGNPEYLTQCPYRQEFKVGSSPCRHCHGFCGITETKQEVVCDYLHKTTPPHPKRVLKDKATVIRTVDSLIEGFREELPEITTKQAVLDALREFKEVVSGLKD